MISAQRDKFKLGQSFGARKPLTVLIKFMQAKALKWSK